MIRGPGATVWGANAVNGVINIITKKAADTQGLYVLSGGGTEKRGFVTARYGGQLGRDVNYRVYGKWFEWDGGYAPLDNDQDDWRMGRGGFRADWTPGCWDEVTFQGDYYDGTSGRRNRYAAFPDPDPFPPPPDFTTVVDDDGQLEGGNLLFRWTRQFNEDSDWSLQLYYDRTERHWQAAGFSEDLDTFDMDFQHRFPLADCHSIIWGFRYRNMKGDIHPTNLFVGTEPAGTFAPHRRADDLISYLVQDDITLHEDLLHLILGSKFVHTDYTKFEYQPTVRLLWTPGERHSIWGAISRAVRIPTRAEADIRIVLPPPTPGLPLFPQVLGNREMESEELLAYEAGIRGQPTEEFAWDLAVFYHDYDGIRSTPLAGFNPGPPALAQLAFANGNAAETYGFELTTNYQATPCWKLYGMYSFLRVTGDTGSDAGDPRNHIFFGSGWDLGRDWELDLMWRYVDSAPGVDLFGAPLPGVSSYNVMDVRLAWHPRPNLELAVVGRNLLDGEHPEFAVDTFLGNVVTEVQSEVYGMVTWRY